MIGTHLAFGGIALFWLGVLARVRKDRGAPKWSLGPETPLPEGIDLSALPRLVVVVPARDEAANIGACVRALAASDHPHLEIVVFDDGSTDGTGELAAAAVARAETVGGGRIRARVVRGGGEPLPEGWKGKPWALQRATRALDSDWVVFLDADVRVHPACLSRVHARALADGVDFLSGFGKLEMVGFWEKVIQPSVGGLILAGNNLDAVNDPARTDAVIANGQLILVRRAAYEAVGGHGAVRADILDDVGLARAFRSHGFLLRILFLRELFSCRMYTNFRELWLGWTKNLYAGMGYSLGRVAFLAGFIVYEFVWMWIALVVGVLTGDTVWMAWGAALVVLSQLARLWLDGIFGQDRRFGILQPVGAVLLVGLILDSARRSRRGAVVWKGRTYAALPEQAARAERVDPAVSGPSGEGEASPPDASGPAPAPLADDGDAAGAAGNDGPVEPDGGGVAEGTPSAPNSRFSRAKHLLHLVPVVVGTAWIAHHLGIVDRQAAAIAPLSGLAFATFGHLAHNLANEGLWTQTVHFGYADDWRWGGHYAGLWPLLARVAGAGEDGWSLARWQVALVGAGVFPAWWLGWKDAGPWGAIVNAFLYASAGMVSILALSDYQDLTLILPLTVLLIAAARHAPWWGFLAAAAAFGVVREEAVILLPVFAIFGGWRRALLGLAVAGVIGAAWFHGGSPPYPNPLLSQVPRFFAHGAGGAVVRELAHGDVATYARMVDAGSPWMLLAPESWLGALPTLVFHAADRTRTTGLGSPAVHHLAPLVAVGLVGGMVGAGRVLARCGRWTPLVALAMLAWTGWRATEWRTAVQRFGVRVTEDAAKHPAWGLLAKVPAEEVVYVPSSIAPAAVKRRFVVTEDSAGDRVPVSRVRWAVVPDGGSVGGTVTERADRWVLVHYPQIEQQTRGGRPEPHRGGVTTGRQ